MVLKIAGGLYKGLRLETPSGTTTRPTSEILREAVFNICQHKIDNAAFLDLYAGSGAMGIEAISRGAKEALFVENNKNALIALKKNIATAAIQEKTNIFPYDIFVSLKKLCPHAFDLVYIDPPYGEKKEELLAERSLDKILTILDTEDLLHKKAWIFVEFSAYSKKNFATLPLHKIKWHNTRAFGRSNLHLFKCID